jgi:hypothetical protein
MFVTACLVFEVFTSCGLIYRFCIFYFQCLHRFFLLVDLTHGVFCHSSTKSNFDLFIYLFILCFKKKKNGNQGIPVAKLLLGEKERLLAMEDHLAQRVVGTRDFPPPSELRGRPKFRAGQKKKAERLLAESSKSATIASWIFF